MCVLLCAIACAGDHGFSVTTESERKDLEVLERARRQWELNNRPAQAAKGGGKSKPSGFVCVWVAVSLDCMCARFDFRTVPLRRAAAAPAAEAAAKEAGLINSFYDECLQLCCDMRRLLQGFGKGSGKGNRFGKGGGGGSQRPPPAKRARLDTFIL